MGGMADPREEDVESLEPDFTLPEEVDEIDQNYLQILLALLATFYQEYKDADPEYILETIDSRTAQLLEDIEGVISHEIPRIGRLGADEALTIIQDSARTYLTPDEEDAIDFTAMWFTAMQAMRNKAVEETVVDNSYILTEQKLTSKAIVEEIRNDMKSSAVYVQHRLPKEPGSRVKVGNILRRGVFRSKKMAMYGARTVYMETKLAYYNTVYTDDTLYDWITMRDGRVCAFCRYFELNGPYPMELLPPCPYHPLCRCDIRPSKIQFRKSFFEFIKDFVKV